MIDLGLWAIPILFSLLYLHYRMRNFETYRRVIEGWATVTILLAWYIAIAPHRIESLKIAIRLIFR